MKIYEFLARRNWPRTYTGKILFVSFLGVHVPMFGAVTYVLVADPTPFVEQLDVLGAMLVATLLGTAATMFVMTALLAPVRAATDAANGYLRHRRTPRLPTRYTDGAGVLMASIQECITRLDGALTTSELQRQQIELDHAAKFKTLAGMKHDFRTPLTVILGFSELMKAEAIGPLGSDAYRKYVATIGKSGHDLLATLQSVLDLSDAEAQGQLAEDSEDFDLSAMAEEAVALEHLHAEKRDVTVELAGAPGVTAHAVPKAAKNLLGALLQCAISGTPVGGRVTLEMERDASFTVRAHAGLLSLEDVPAELTHFFGSLKSSTGSLAISPETSTPMTLRISLIETLCRAVGARFSMGQVEGEGFRMKVELEPRAVPTAIAAE